MPGEGFIPIDIAGPSSDAGGAAIGGAAAGPLGFLASLFGQNLFSNIFGYKEDFPEGQMGISDLFKLMGGTPESFSTALKSGVFTNPAQNGYLTSIQGRGDGGYGSEPLITAKDNYLSNFYNNGRNQGFELGTPGAPGSSQDNPFLSTRDLGQNGAPLGHDMWIKDGNDSVFGHYTEVGGGRGNSFVIVPKGSPEPNNALSTLNPTQYEQQFQNPQQRISPDVQNFLDSLNKFSDSYQTAHPMASTNDSLQQPNTPGTSQAPTVMPSAPEMPSTAQTPMNEMFQQPQNIQAPQPDQPQAPSQAPIIPQMPMPPTPQTPAPAPEPQPPTPTPQAPVPQTPAIPEQSPVSQMFPNTSPLTDVPPTPAQEIKVPQDIKSEMKEPQQETPSIPALSNLFSAPGPETSNLGGNQTQQQNQDQGIGQSLGQGLSDLFKPVQPSGEQFKLPDLPKQQQPMNLTFPDFPQQNFSPGSGQSGAFSQNSAYGGTQMSPVTPGLSGQSTQSFSQQGGGGDQQQQQPGMQPMGMSDLWSNFLRF